MTPVAYNDTLTIVSRDDNLVPKWWWLRFNIRRLFCWGASPWQSRRHADNCVSSQNPLQLVSSQETGVTLKPCFRGSISAGWTRGNNTWFCFYCFLKVFLCIFFYQRQFPENQAKSDEARVDGVGTGGPGVEGLPLLRGLLCMSLCSMNEEHRVQTS